MRMRGQHAANQPLNSRQNLNVNLSRPTASSLTKTILMRYVMVRWLLLTKFIENFFCLFLPRVKVPVKIVFYYVGTEPLLPGYYLGIESASRLYCNFRVERVILKNYV